jgi:hypothetical protein
MGFFSGLLGLCLLSPAATAADLERRVDLGPGFEGWTLEISPGRERRGLTGYSLRVLDATGRERQTLHHRSDLGSPEGLRAGLLLEDVDFDGYRDLGLVRSFGAKWMAYRIWRFDPQRGRFVENHLTRALGRLANLEVDGPRRELVSTSIGPCDPWCRRYRVEHGRLRLIGEERPVPAGTCMETGSASH